MSDNHATCSVCGKRFEVRFSYQAQKTADGVEYFCSQLCHQKALFGKKTRRCDVCGTEFTFSYAYQQVMVGGRRLNVCSTACRAKALSQGSAPGRDDHPRQEPGRDRAHKLAVLNQKGGTGKTTTSVNLAAGLAMKGYRTLLIDMDAQGNVSVSLGVKGKYTMYHVLMGHVSPTEASVEVRDNLFLIPANESLATGEIKLAQMTRGRDRVLDFRMRGVKAYDYVIIDCGPSLSLLNQNALTYADQVLIPVSCDYLSLVGVKQILKTLKMVNEILHHPITILGVLPTFYDRRNRISHEAVRTLKDYFGDKVLPPIRINTRLKEAPSHRMTIFEYAPDSAGAKDYMRLVHWLIAHNTGVGVRAVEASVAKLSPELARGMEGPVMDPVGRVRSRKHGGVITS